MTLSELILGCVSIELIRRETISCEVCQGPLASYLHIIYYWIHYIVEPYSCVFFKEFNEQVLQEIFPVRLVSNNVPGDSYRIEAGCRKLRLEYSQHRGGN